MLHTRPSLILKRHIKAAPAKVSAAWTDPEKIMRWFGSDQGPTLHAETDLRAGGRFRIVFRTIDGEERDVSGAYRELVPGRKLTFTWNWPSPREPESLLTIHPQPPRARTLLPLTHD